MTELKNPEPLAAQVAAFTYLEKPARRLLTADQPALMYVALLTEREYFPDAARMIANLLPPREAVWWACQCARQAPLPDAPPEWTAALDASEKWVAEMTEETRRAAEPLAHEAGLSTAPGCAALAAFNSGGSIAPPEMQAVEATPCVCAQLAAASITISALTPHPAQAPDKYRQFLQQGIDLYRSTIP